MTDPDLTGKWRNLSVLSIACLLAMTLWFSASAVLPQLQQTWSLGTAASAWLTMSVQLGFVAGALVSAIFNVADRVSSRTLFVCSALLGAAANASIPLLQLSAPAAMFMRGLTGFALAGVYPPGMKLMATWCLEDRGFGIGLLVGALTFGSAMPHLLNALPVNGMSGMPPWPQVLLITSGMAVAGALLAGTAFRPGPFLSKTAPFDWKFAARVFSDRGVRYANFGYLGHMWELYAMWAWVPLFLVASYAEAGGNAATARLAGFATIAAGALGSIVAGLAADRTGRTTVAIVSLALSGACCLIVGSLFSYPGLLTAVCLVWGFAVVADSAQFSTAVTELADSRYVGTALTVQTSLGFLLTLASIHLVPVVVHAAGWSYVFLFLVPGPVLGIWSMLKLRRLPEAVQLASGNR